jgi:hypothetical protein
MGGTNITVPDGVEVTGTGVGVGGVGVGGVGVGGVGVGGVEVGGVEVGGVEVGGVTVGGVAVGGVAVGGVAVGGVDVPPPPGSFVPVEGGGETTAVGKVAVGFVGEGRVSAVEGGRVTLGVALGSNTIKGGKNTWSLEPAPGVRKVSNQLIGVRMAERTG